AVGGRMSLVGAVYGALLVNFGKTYFSESFPDLWLFLMAGMFLGVVLAFPDGLAGVYNNRVKPGLAKRFGKSSTPAASPPAPPATPAVSSDAPALPAGLSGQQT
ncbi:MAG: urea ABC transporter permease subunit UrtC, partial [Polaromonas sp.]